MEELLELVRKSSYEKQYTFVDILYGILVKGNKIPKGSLMLLIVYADKDAIIEAMLRAGIDTPNTASTGQAASGSQSDDNSKAACR